MVRKLLYCLFIATLALPVFAQVQIFEHLYGGSNKEYLSDIRRTADNGFLLSATTSSYIDSTSRNGFVIKTDEYGVIQWQKAFGEKKVDESVFHSASGPNGNHLLLVNITEGISKQYATVLMIDANGDSLWQKSYDVLPDQLNLIRIQPVGSNFLIWGSRDYHYAGPPRPYHSVGYIMKINSIGDTLWTKEYDKAYWHTSYTFSSPTLDHQYVLISRIRDSTGGKDTNGILNSGQFWGITKIDSNGVINWEKRYAFPDYKVINLSTVSSVVSTSDSGFIVLMNMINSYQPGHEPKLEELRLIKLDKLGDSLWSKSFTGLGYGKIAIDKQDNIILVAQIEDGQGDYPGELLKLDAMGNKIWQKSLYDDHTCGIFDLEALPDGRIAVGGSRGGSTTSGNNCDLFLIVTDSLGRFTPIGIADHSKQQDNNIVHTYPNPFNEQVNFVFSENSLLPIQLSIFDQTGRLIELMQINDKIKEWKPTTISSGLYFYFAVDRNGQTQQGKLIFDKR